MSQRDRDFYTLLLFAAIVAAMLIGLAIAAWRQAH